MRILVALAMAIALTSCAQLKNLGSDISAGVSVVTGTSVTQQQVAVGVTAFDAVQSTATTWMSLPDCTTAQKPWVDACKDGTKKAQVAAAVRKGRQARDDVWTASKGATTGIGAVTLFNTMVTATSAVKILVTKPAT